MVNVRTKITDVVGNIEDTSVESYPTSSDDVWSVIELGVLVGSVQLKTFGR